MQAVILAGGFGTRLRPITNNLPKPMIKINGKPILEHTLKNLPDVINEVLIVTYYLEDHIKDYFGNRFCDKKISYVHQNELRGTARALSFCKDYLYDDKFLICMGDDIYHKNDLEKIINHDLAILAACHIPRSTLDGLILNEKNYLIGFENYSDGYPKDIIVNTGAYVLDKEIFNYPEVFSKKIKEYSLPLTLLQITKKRPIKVEFTKFWLPISYPEDIKKAEEFLINILKV